MPPSGGIFSFTGFSAVLPASLRFADHREGKPSMEDITLHFIWLSISYNVNIQYRWL